MNKTQQGSAAIVAISFGAIGLIFTGMIATSIYKAAATTETVTVKVTGKERIVESNGDQTSSKYLIFTQDEVFENTDSLFLFKFNSSDIYGKIEKDDTCTFVVNGWRVRFLSMYRNIITAECK